MCGFLDIGTIEWVSTWMIKLEARTATGFSCPSTFLLRLKKFQSLNTCNYLKTKPILKIAITEINPVGIMLQPCQLKGMWSPPFYYDFVTWFIWNCSIKRIESFGCSRVSFILVVVVCNDVATCRNVQKLHPVQFLQFNTRTSQHLLLPGRTTPYIHQVQVLQHECRNV